MMEESPEVIGQRAGGGVPSGGDLLEALERDGAEIAWNRGIQNGRRHRVGLANVEQSVLKRLRHKRWTAGQQFIEQRADCVNVAWRADLRVLPGRLFR